MPKFVIERAIPGAGKMSPEQIKGLSQKNLQVLGELGPQIQWLHSYFTDDKVYCVIWAPDEETIREHSRRLGVPADRVSAVRQLVESASSE